MPANPLGTSTYTRSRTPVTSKWSARHVFFAAAAARRILHRHFRGECLGRFAAAGARHLVAKERWRQRWRRGAPVLATQSGAHHYQFIGIKFSTDHWIDTLVQLGGSSDTSTAALPHHVTFDRCLFEGAPAAGTKHGLMANAGQGATFPDDKIAV